MMIPSSTTTPLRLSRGVTIAVALGACLWMAHPGIGAAQNSTAEPTAQTSPVMPVQPSHGEGLVDLMGHWMQQGVSTVGSGFGAVAAALGDRANKGAKGAADAASTVAKGAADAAKATADAARDTAVSVSRLTATGVVGGREPCIVAPNGAPDCREAAEAICRSNGYGGGTSVDFETSQKCPPSYRVTSRNNSPVGVCRMEHFVTRALCR